MLRPFLPATGGTQVVVTSTDQAFAELGQAVNVAVFTRPESLGYLRARTGLADEDGATAVADELGDLPLGLAQAAATIRRQNLDYPSYLHRLRRVPVRALLGSVPGGDYPRATAAALLLSIQATEASDPSGLTSRLLRVVAVLSPDGVRRDLLAGLAAPGRSDRRQEEREEEGEEAVDAAVERCVAGSLLTWSVTRDAVIMHRLLGRVLRERDQADGRWAGTVTAALDLLELRLFSEDQAWARREEGAHLAAQAEALWEANAGARTDDGNLALRHMQARSWAVRQLSSAADLSRAIDAGIRTLADSKLTLGANHPHTLTSQHNLAQAYNWAGRLDQAIPLYEQTVADRERILGADHPDTLTSRHRLTGAYMSAGRLEQAIRLHEQILADRERILGADHPDTLTSRNSLAYAYSSAGRLDQAIPLYEQTLADRERILGADHPETLFSRNNLAGAYRWAGRLDQAIRLHEQTVADRERILGADHPETLFSRDHLARAYRSAGRWNRRSGCTSRPWPTASGSWAPTTRTPSPPGTTSPTPTSPRAGWTRRSGCTSRPWPTASGSWAPTTLGRSSRGTASQAPTGRRAGWTRRSRSTSRHSPTASGFSGPTTPEPSPPGSTSSGRGLRPIPPDPLFLRQSRQLRQWRPFSWSRHSIHAVIRGTDTSRAESSPAKRRAPHTCGHCQMPSIVRSRRHSEVAILRAPADGSQQLPTAPSQRFAHLHGAAPGDCSPTVTRIRAQTQLGS